MNLAPPSSVMSVSCCSISLVTLACSPSSFSSSFSLSDNFREIIVACCLKLASFVSLRSATVWSMRFRSDAMRLWSSMMLRFISSTSSAVRCGSKRASVMRASFSRFCSSSRGSSCCTRCVSCWTSDWSCSNNMCASADADVEFRSPLSRFSASFLRCSAPWSATFCLRMLSPKRASSSCWSRRLFVAAKSLWKSWTSSFCRFSLSIFWWSCFFSSSSVAISCFISTGWMGVWRVFSTAWWARLNSPWRCL
mmetsp:Transcript_33056/g.112222  ORF Transcript_33056/g.112222 Transcript_33056/m.112222 type:complete len:251 (+) Transcript_33056:1773-2525(+)